MTVPSPERAAATRLTAVKTLHTIIWAFFAGCILAIPALAFSSRYCSAVLLIAVVSVEVLVLFLNGWKCPLTGVAARYTPERRDNFDIYLPEWLARHNKRIFGALYVGGVLLTAVLWAVR